MKGDTTINGNVYKKLYFRRQIFGEVKDVYLTSLKEASGKIYASDYNWNGLNYTVGEYLLYDFSAEVGDTIKSNITSDCNCNLSKPMVITSISTVTLQNGERRKSFQASNSRGWIEGIGNLNGLFYDAFPLCTCIDRPQLICYKQYDSYLFSQGTIWGSNCDLVSEVDNTTINSPTKATLSNNPLTTSTTLKWNDTNRYTSLIVTDLLGKTIKQISIDGLNEYSINRSDLSKGLFIVRLSSKDGKQETVKLIVE